MPINAEKIGIALADKMIRYQPKEVHRALQNVNKSKKSPENKLISMTNLCKANWKYVAKSIPPRVANNKEYFSLIEYDATSACAWHLASSPLFPKRRDTNY